MAEPDFHALCAELAEPPTDKELENTYNRAVSNYLCSIKAKRTLVEADLADSRLSGLRAIYSWGQGNACPEPPTDDEIWAMYQDGQPGSFAPAEFARAVLARWGQGNG